MIDPDDTKDAQFDRLFGDDQSFSIPAGDDRVLIGPMKRPARVPVRVVADATYRKMIAHINTREPFSEAECLDMRTALLTASAMADTAMQGDHSMEDRAKLNKARWAYLKLAERLA